MELLVFDDDGGGVRGGEGEEELDVLCDESNEEKRLNLIIFSLICTFVT